MARKHRPGWESANVRRLLEPKVKKAQKQGLYFERAKQKQAGHEQRFNS